MVPLGRGFHWLQSTDDFSIVPQPNSGAGMKPFARTLFFSLVFRNYSILNEK